MGTETNAQGLHSGRSQKDRVVGFACGVFDLFHAGHAIMLEECKSQCNYLIVGLNKSSVPGEGKNHPIYDVGERKLILEACKYVDEVIMYDGDDELLKLMQKIDIDVRFLGRDWKGKEIVGPNQAKRIYYLNRDHGYSSSDVRKRVVEAAK